MKSDVQKVHWKQLAGNPYVISLDIRMFLIDGHHRYMRCYLKGESVKLMAPTLRLVTFDIDFVTAKVEKTLLSPTGIGSIEKLQELIELAHKNKRAHLTETKVSNPIPEKHYIPEFFLVE